MRGGGARRSAELYGGLLGDAISQYGGLLADRVRNFSLGGTANEYIQSMFPGFGSYQIVDGRITFPEAHPPEQGVHGLLGEFMPGPDIGGAFSGIVKNAGLDAAAKRHFGRTFSPEETGYIMDDGTRLDFSGRHYASGYEQTPRGFKPKPGQPDYLAGWRNVDHRELDDLVEDGGSEGMLKFMDESGAVRYMRGHGITVMTNNMPSDKQIEMVVKDFRARGLPLMVDVTKPNGYSAATHEFERPTVGAVLEFIRKHQQ